MEDPALSLVKGIVDIESILERLKLAYGDPKTMLNKNLSQLNNLESLWKHRDSEKTADGLSKIVSVMKDLVETQERQKIENKLYNGDVIKLLGDARVTRWLSDVCDQSMTDDDQLSGERYQSSTLKTPVQINKSTRRIQRKAPTRFQTKAVYIARGILEITFLH